MATPTAIEPKTAIPFDRPLSLDLDAIEWKLANYNLDGWERDNLLLLKALLERHIPASRPDAN
jgi:hypothetical protein